MRVFLSVESMQAQGCDVNQMKRLADVRVVQVKPATSQSERLEAITDMYPEVGRLVELMGLQIPAAKKSAAGKKNK